MEHALTAIVIMAVIAGVLYDAFFSKPKQDQIAEDAATAHRLKVARRHAAFEAMREVESEIRKHHEMVGYDLPWTIGRGYMSELEEMRARRDYQQKLEDKLFQLLKLQRSLVVKGELPAAHYA